MINLQFLMFIMLSFYIGEDHVIVFVANDYIKDKDGTYIHWSGEEVDDFLKSNPHLTYPFLPIVNQTWKQAECKLRPQPVNPNIPSNSHIHEKKVMQQRNSLCQSNILIAGHKKDVVISNKPNYVAIYGWHQLNGKIIQPYSTIHNNKYKDYSHGFRPMSKIIIINNIPYLYTELQARYGFFL
jgi:hypothetical protein